MIHALCPKNLCIKVRVGYHPGCIESWRTPRREYTDLMPPRSPLPHRFGLNAAWLRTEDRSPGGIEPWLTMREWLHSRVGEHISVSDFLRDQRFVYQDGSAVDLAAPYEPHTFVWFHRDIAPEATVPGKIHILHRDERLIVIDKPPFLSSIPRGKHILQSVVVRLRDELNLPDLSPLHRLDRVTSGVLMLAPERKWRGPYQSMFMGDGVQKTYLAVAPVDETLAVPRTVRSHISKTRGVLQAETIEGAAPNSESVVQLVDTVTVPGYASPRGIYRLSPRTGKTHQLRLHMLQLGVPIDGDPLYPRVLDLPIDDFSAPLQLLAQRISFSDPVDGSLREFTSARKMPLSGETALRTAAPENAR